MVMKLSSWRLKYSKLVKDDRFKQLSRERVRQIELSGLKNFKELIYTERYRGHLEDMLDYYKGQ